MSPRFPSPWAWSCAVLLSSGTGCAAPDARTSELRTASTPAATLPAPGALAASRKGDIAEPVRLELVDDFNPPRPPPAAAGDVPAARWDAALGGLSGLYFDAPSATLYAISDEPRRFPPRLYSFGIELTASALRVWPTAVTLIHEVDPSARERLQNLDSEGITGDGHGGFYVCTENADDRPTQQEPRILLVNPNGVITGQLPLPPAYLPAPSGAPARGTRSNEAFEGISVSPSGRWLTAITESPLHQDGDAATFEHGARVRILRWYLGSSTAPREFSYPIEPLPRPAHGTPTGGNNGASELVSLDDRRLLVLERAFVPLAEEQGPNTIRIYEVILPDEPATPGAAPQPLEKRLVLDLADVVGGFDRGLQTLDNMEGMTLGPDLPNGDASLLLVTDDNFKKEQRTMFLALRLPRVR